MIQAEYKKNFDGHYLIITNEMEKPGYRLEMILNNRIKGLLNLELEIIDNRNQYYYDITHKQSLAQILENNVLNFDQTKRIIRGIIGAIEEGKEYLLSEDDFVLDPEYIYIATPDYEVSLCYLIGYEKDVMDQFIRLIEFLMNKVDYKDEQGVLFIYGVYKISKEECLTFDKIKSFINTRYKEEQILIKEGSDDEKEENTRADTYHSGVQRDDINSDNVLKGKKTEANPKNINQGIGIFEHRFKERRRKYKDKKKSNEADDKTGTDNLNKSKTAKGKMKYDKKDVKNKDLKNPHKLAIPMMEERIDSEEEILVYSGKTISLLILSIIICIIIIFTGYKFNFFYNSYNGDFDIIKIFGYILVLGTVEIYIISKLLQEKNKVPKIKEKTEYLSNIEERDMNIIYKREDLMSQKSIAWEEDFQEAQSNEYKSKSYIENQEEELFLNENENEKTVLLTTKEEPLYILESVDPSEYKNIKIIESPFFIGKLNKQVEESLNSNVISRFHAKLEEKEGQLYITDLDSTNGTFINSNRLGANETRELHMNDEICFANIKYRLAKTNSNE